MDSISRPSWTPQRAQWATRFPALAGTLILSAAYFGAPAARAEPSLWFLEKVEITRGAIADHLSKTLSFLFIKSFNELAARADLNFDDCVDFLAEENHDSFERQIAILSVHKASLSAHLEFIERMAGLVAEGKVTSSEFEYALSPLKVFSTVVSDS
jgi:hypothetical protein